MTERTSVVSKEKKSVEELKREAIRNLRSTNSMADAQARRNLTSQEFNKYNHQDSRQLKKTNKMPDKDLLLEKLNRGSNYRKNAASFDASNNLNSQQFASYNPLDLKDYEIAYAQEIKRAKKERDRLPKETGFWQAFFLGLTSISKIWQ